MKGIWEGRKSNKKYSFPAYITVAVILLTAAIHGSCTKQDEFTIGKDFIESQTRLLVVDTFRVDLSTILLDSVRSSASQVMLAGNYSDGFFGSVKCESYFDLAYETFRDLEERAVYDSAAIVLPYSGFVYGDTLSPMTLHAHVLTEKISTYNDGYLYTTSSFDYETEPRGSITFYPSPATSSDSAVFIPVNELGEELFNKINEKDPDVTSEEWFLDYLKGFLITSGSDINNAVIGFDAAEGKVALKIYYHLRLEDPVKKELTVKMGLSNKQFNHIDLDLSGTPLDNILASGNRKNSAFTGNKAFMQGLTGLMAKVQFPSLQDIFLATDWKILKAELIIEPEKFSFEQFSLPEKLYIYETDRVSRINAILRDENDNSLSSLKDGNNSPLAAILQYDEMYPEEIRYTFNITSYLIRELSGKYFEYKRGLHIALDQDFYRKTLERVIFEGKNPRVKLKLYYLTY